MQLGFPTGTPRAAAGAGMRWLNGLAAELGLRTIAVADGVAVGFGGTDRCLVVRAHGRILEEGVALSFHVTYRSVHANASPPTLLPDLRQTATATPSGYRRSAGNLLLQQVPGTRLSSQETTMTYLTRFLIAVCVLTLVVALVDDLFHREKGP